MHLANPLFLHFRTKTCFDLHIGARISSTYACTIYPTITQTRWALFRFVFTARVCAPQAQCMLLSKEDFRSCMHEKKFQEVMEEVVYQRAAYREQRELQTEHKVWRSDTRRRMS